MRAWSVVSPLDADERPQLRHAARQARLLRRRHYGADVLVGAGRFLRDAARGGATDHDPLRGQIVDDFAAAPLLERGVARERAARAVAGGSERFSLAPH